MGLYDDILSNKAAAPSTGGAYDDILKGSSTISQETAKAVPRVLGGIAQEAGEAAQYLTGDRVGLGLRKWGEKTQADNAMTPGFVAEHPVIAEAGQAAESVAKMAPYAVAETATSLAPVGGGLKAAAHAVLPVVMGASQGQRSYESGLENGLGSDAAMDASKLPAAVTTAGMASMGAAVGGVRKVLPKAMDITTARAAGRSLMSSVLPDLAAGTAAGTAVMQAQSVATALAEKATGARPNADPMAEIIKNPKSWLQAALTGGMFEALSVPGKLAQGEGIKAALNHPEVPKATKAQIIIGTAEEIKKTDPEAAAEYRTTELEKLHKGEELDTAPLEALLPKEPEKAPPVEDQHEEIINALAESLGLEDESPVDVLQRHEEEKAATHIGDKITPHAEEAAAEAAKTPEDRAQELIQRGQLVIRRGESLDPAVEEALAAEGKMLKDLGPERTGAVPRHRYEVVDIPLEEVDHETGAAEVAGVQPAETAEGAVQEEAAVPAASEEVATQTPGAKSITAPDYIGAGAASEEYPKMLGEARKAITAGNYDKVTTGKGKALKLVHMDDGGRQGEARVLAFDGKGKLVGDLSYSLGTMEDGRGYNPHVDVVEGQRRKGVATALYDAAEARGGKIPAHDQPGQVRSDEGEAFRAARAGKTLDPVKATEELGHAQAHASATAPEHVASTLNAKQLAEVIKNFNEGQKALSGDEDRPHHLFDPPAKKEIVRLNDKVKAYHKEHGWMTPEEAKAKIKEWKDNAEAQGKSGVNRGKVVLSLFDLTGKWSEPWVKAGYDVYRFDIQDNPEVGDVNKFSANFFGDYFGDFDGADIHAILAAVPCTDFANSGNKHKAAKLADGRTAASVQLVHQTLRAIEYFKPSIWAVENPVGQIESLGGLPPWRAAFDPNAFGDPYTKKTLLWGRFNGDMPIAPVPGRKEDGGEGSKMWEKYGGKSMATKNARSETPEGFAYAFFQANNAVDHPAMEIAHKYDRLDKGVIEEAVKKGVSKGEIDDAIADHYYMDLDDDTAHEALKDLIKEKGGAAASIGDAVKGKLIKFASGMSAITDLKSSAKTVGGMKKSGMGIVVDKVSKNGIDQLAKSVVDHDTRAFVDSGAFSAARKGWKTGEEANVDFAKVAKVYDDLRNAIDQKLEEEGKDWSDIQPPMMVLPDVVGDQAKSLKALEDNIHLFTLDGGSILPIQKGEMSLAEYYHKAKEIVDQQAKGSLTEDVIVGIPSNEAAVTAKEFEDFVREVRPTRVHFLGAIDAKKLEPKLEAFGKAGYEPDYVSSDASLVRSKVVRIKEDIPRSEKVQKVTRELAGKEFEDAVSGLPALKNGEQRLAYEDNPNLVVARKDDKIALIDQKEGKLLGLAKVREDGKLGAWEKGKEPATPQERVEAEDALRRHLGETRMNRTPSADEIAEAKKEVVSIMADPKRLEAEAGQRGITVDDFSTRLELQLAQYNKILKGESTYADLQAPLEAAAIKAHLDPIIKKLRTPVEIVGSSKDIPGLDTDVAFNGAFHDGKIYLNAEHLGSLKEAERVLLEHEISHSGLRGMLGRDFDPVLAKVWLDRETNVRAFAEEKGIDWLTKAGKAEAAEEYIVSLAEHGQTNKAWEGFVATVKSWLRKAGFDLKFSDAELRDLVLKAREFEQGGDGTRFARVFHGTTADKVDGIEQEGALRPVGSEGIKRTSMGLTTEGGLIWTTVDKGIARMYAKGIESLEDKKPGKIYAADLPDNLKSIDRHQPLTQEQVDTLNTMVPEYKALEPGDSLSTFEWRVKNGYGLKDALKALGMDAVTMSNGKQIGYLTEKLPVTAHETLFNRVTAAAPAEAREGVSAVSDVAFKTSAVLKHLGDRVFRFVFPEDRIIKAALGTFRFNPIHEQLGNLSEYKQRMAGAATDILHAVHTNATGYKKLLGTEELQDKAARLAFLESVYQLDGSAPLGGQWTPETREIPDTHPNAPEGATREVPSNEWKAPKVKGFAEAETLEEAYREIRSAMADLTPEQLKAVRGLQDHIKEADRLRRDALKAKNNFLFGEGSEEAEAANAGIDEVSRLAGRYMPLTRFGEHLVRVYEGPEGDHVRTQSFESRSGAVDYVKEMRDQGKHAVLEVREAHDGHATSIPVSFLDKVQKAAEANGLEGRDLENFIAEYKRQWASTLPDSSLRANEVRRSNMAGFDTNLLRVYEHHMQKFANAVPKIRYGVKVEQTFRDMRNNIQAIAESDHSDPRLVQELYELHNALYERQHVGDNERINPLVKMLNKGVFLNYLASPSVWLVQWSQPFMITLPKLASRHGAVSSTAEFNKAAKEYMWGKFSDQKIQEFDSRHSGIGERVLGLMDDLKLEPRAAEQQTMRRGINEIFEGLTPEDQALLVQKMMILRGGNDLAFSHDVADDISGAGKLDRGINKAVEAGGIFMRKSETGSRRAANLAAFKLEYAKTRDFTKASDYAMNIIDDTLYNFDSENRAGWMRGNAGRLLGMFQYFRLHTVAKEMQLVRDAIGRQHDQAIKAANGDQAKIAAAKEKKLEARKELAFQMAATMTFAGAAGTPLAMMVSNTVTDTLWSALQFLFGDPDDPITLSQMAEAKAKEMFGEDAANVLSRGIFSLANIDVSRRIGMGGMANLVPGDPPPGLSGSRRSEWYAARILGPSWGMLTDQMRATEAFANGDTGMAMQYASPKILKDMLKAFDINENGVTAATGKTIMPPEMVTPYSVALQMVGINPMDVTLAKEEAREVSNLSTVLTQRRSHLVTEFQKAQTKGDFEAREEALEAISAWGQKNPKLAISHKELANAVKRAMDKAAGKSTKKEELAKDMLEKAGE